MEMPTPVSLGALEGLLARSKQVMQQVEAKNPIVQKGNDSGLAESYTPQQTTKNYGYDESDEKDMSYGDYKAPERDVTQIVDYTEEQVMASNLPPAIKEAMLKNRIPRLSGPPSKVSPEAIARMTGIQPKQQQPQTRQPLTENVNNSGMVTVSKEQLQAMIKEGIDNFFKNDYEKRITEAAIKKTITVLIKEGKLNTKK
jgi:hypothetical protein